MKITLQILSQKLQRITRKLVTFCKSLAFHIYSGFPKSSLLDIKYRYTICQSCEYLDIKKSQCEICGCNVNTKKIFMNKLAWADQECPMGKWKKLT